MEEKDFNPIVKMFFQDHGFTANEIPREKDKQTPDFDVIGKNDRYTVELKIKSDDPNEIARDNEFLSKGQMVTKSIPIGPRNRLSGIIQKGVDQMTTHDPQRKTYQVIWIHTIGKNQDLLNTRFRSTLFGLEKLFSIDISHVITCYYFHNSAFFTWRNYLDAALLTTENTVQLCINSLSPRVNDFRGSDLYKSLIKGLCDPIKYELADGVMIADCEIDRKEENQILNYLMKKYCLKHLQTIPMQQNSATISMPINQS